MSIFKNKKELTEEQKNYRRISKDYKGQTAIDLILEMTTVEQIRLFIKDEDRQLISKHAETLIQNITEEEKNKPKVHTPSR